jgi:hypothetical protein
MRAVQANRGMASSVQGLYMAELSKIAARKDDAVRYNHRQSVPSIHPPIPRRHCPPLPGHASERGARTEPGNGTGCARELFVGRAVS